MILEEDLTEEDLLILYDENQNLMKENEDVLESEETPTF